MNKNRLIRTLEQLGVELESLITDESINSFQKAFIKEMDKLDDIIAGIQDGYYDEEKEEE